VSTNDRGICRVGITGSDETLNKGGIPVFVVVMSTEGRSWNHEELMALDSTLT
jgi:hypothetical protein